MRNIALVHSSVWLEMVTNHRTLPVSTPRRINLAQNSELASQDALRKFGNLYGTCMPHQTQCLPQQKAAA